MNGARVNSIVEELRGEKIDIINWDENPAILIENALSPAKVIAVMADPEEKTALVVVPDYQLSLAIGKEGQNARLAARLTGFKIDIKSETQARESGDLYDYDEEEEYYEDEAAVQMQKMQKSLRKQTETEEVSEEVSEEDDNRRIRSMKTKNKIPMRQCTGCREMKSKKEMIRVLKTPEDEIVLDTTGRKNGRGAYVCLSTGMP